MSMKNVDAQPNTGHICGIAVSSSGGLEMNPAEICRPWTVSLYAVISAECLLPMMKHKTMHIFQNTV